MLGHFDAWQDVLDHLTARSASPAVIKAAGEIWDFQRRSRPSERAGLKGKVILVAATTAN